MVCDEQMLLGLQGRRSMEGGGVYPPFFAENILSLTTPPLTFLLEMLYFNTTAPGYKDTPTPLLYGWKGGDRIQANTASV